VLIRARVKLAMAPFDWSDRDLLKRISLGTASSLCLDVSREASGERRVSELKKRSRLSAEYPVKRGALMEALDRFPLCVR